MHDAIIGINENQKILFINTAAKSILNLTDQKIEGKAVAELVKDNDLFKSIIEEKKRC